MRELLDKIELWRSQGKQVALATVVKVYGSAPRPLGAKMIISNQGDMEGSVSGGCVEGAVFEEAQASLKRGLPKLVTYGISDETAWSVGLACGGQIEVFVEPLIVDAAQPIFPALDTYGELVKAIKEEIFCAQLTILAGSGIGHKLLIFQEGLSIGSLGNANLDKAAINLSGSIWKNQQPIRFDLDLFGEKTDIFVDVFPAKERIIIVGGVHVAIPLVRFAKQLGFHTIVVDARSVFGNKVRFPEVDELINAWPGDALEKMDINESTYIVVVSHDEKLDNPALKIALNSKARYIGALGSVKTHAKRVAALIDMGVAPELIKKIYAPIGLSIGAVGAEEIAISIMAEIVCVRRNTTL